MYKNQEKKNEYQRGYRKRNNNIQTKKYEKTKKGFLVRCYRNMLSRVTGVTKNKNHLYLGKKILEKRKFYSWALMNKKFHWLFDFWEASDYQRRLTPSIDRIDSSLGYSINNIRWLTFSENSRTFGNSKLSKKQVVEIRKKRSVGRYSIKDLVLEYNMGDTAIRSIINRKTWRHI